MRAAWSPGALASWRPSRALHIGSAEHAQRGQMAQGRDSRDMVDSLRRLETEPLRPLPEMLPLDLRRIRGRLRELPSPSSSSGFGGTFSFPRPHGRPPGPKSGSGSPLPRPGVPPDDATDLTDWGDARRGDDWVRCSVARPTPTPTPTTMEPDGAWACARCI